MTPAASPENRTIVEFDYNRHLINVLGEYDANIALLETRLGVTVQPHGNKLILTGDAAPRQIACVVLDRAYQWVFTGKELTTADFDGLIRHAREEQGTGVGGKPSVGGGIVQGQISTRRKTIKARTVAQSAYIKALERTDLVFGVGPAGTGKTYLAVAYAAYLWEKKKVEKIILSRPAVEAGERLGFLPGDLKDKVDPYLRPLYDALHDCLDKQTVEKEITNGTIEIAPLAFMRGRTLTNAAVILDEAQNTTTMQMKMFLTRLGEGSKMFVNGDPTQIDLPPGTKSGLDEALATLKDIRGIEAIRFVNSDIVRRDLVQRIVEAYDAKK